VGLFDSIYAGCPGCGAKVEFQTKADEQPYMNTYTLDDAPAHLLIDVLNDPHYCQKCGAWLALIDPAYPPNGQPPRPTPTVVRLREPSEDEYQSHFQGFRWWRAPFSYADIAKGDAPLPGPLLDGRS
jgi:hypothetical protein